MLTLLWLLLLPSKRNGIFTLKCERACVYVGWLVFVARRRSKIENPNAFGMRCGRAVENLPVRFELEQLSSIAPSILKDTCLILQSTPL